MILDIVINVYNKEKSIINLFNKIEDELKDIKHNYIFVDNNSDDKTMDVLKDLYKENESKVKIISLSRVHDKEDAIYAGLVHTKHKLICIYDTDLQANVSHIKKMYETLINSEVDSVCMCSSYKEKSFIKRSKITLINKIYELDINNNKTYYRMFKRNVLNALIDLSNNYKFNNYSFDMIGFNTKYINFDNSNIDNTNLKKYIFYSKKPFNFLKIYNIVQILLLFIYFILSLIGVFKLSNSALLIILVLFNILNVYFISLISEYFNKQKTYFSIKEKIGFDDNVL